MKNTGKSKLEAAIAYKNRAFYELALEEFERVPREYRKARYYFNLGELYYAVAKRDQATISPLVYRDLLRKSSQAYKKSLALDRGEYFKTSKRGRIDYKFLRDIAGSRVRNLEAEIAQFRGIQIKKEVVRKKPLVFAEFGRLVIKQFRKKNKSKTDT